MRTLYYSPGACSLAVHIVLEELGAEFATKRVAILSGQNFSPEFLALNPRGHVPLIVTGDSTWRETPAILITLALEDDDARLLPGRDGAGFGEALQWVSWIATAPHIFLMQHWRPHRSVNSVAAQRELADQALENFRRCCGEIEETIRGPFFFGDQFTVVDAYLLFCFRQGNRLGVSMASEYPKFARLAETGLLRPAVRRAFEREQITLGGDRDSLPPMERFKDHAA